ARGVARDLEAAALRCLGAGPRDVAEDALTGHTEGPAPVLAGYAAHRKARERVAVDRLGRVVRVPASGAGCRLKLGKVRLRLVEGEQIGLRNRRARSQREAGPGSGCLAADVALGAERYELKCSRGSGSLKEQVRRLLREREARQRPRCPRDLVGRGKGHVFARLEQVEQGRARFAAGHGRGGRGGGASRSRGRRSRGGRGGGARRSRGGGGGGRGRRG